MKNLPKILFLFGFISVTTAVPADAQSAISFDEFGDGIIDSVAGEFNLGYNLAPDPTGGLKGWNVLIYNLPYAGVQGDVLIFAPDERGNPLDDVIRFTGNSQVIFYADSIQGYTDLADTPGPPQPLYAIQASEEIPFDNIVDYVPGPGQPGYDASNSGYNIYIDISAVPEPGTDAMLVIAAGLLGLSPFSRFKLAGNESAKEDRAKE